MIKDQSDVIAREIIGTAIQRCAADHTAETTVSVVRFRQTKSKDASSAERVVTSALSKNHRC